MTKILTSFKPFVGRAGEIQTRARRNWEELGLEVVEVPGRLRSATPCQGGPPEFGEVRARVEKGEVVIYANGDILFERGLKEAIKAAPEGDFLMIGRRWDEGKVHRPSGMDYFIFRGGMFEDLPRTIVGRAYYDCALVNWCLKRRIKVIDVSGVVKAVHQTHDYGHVEGGRAAVFGGKDALENKRNNGLKDFGPHLADASHEMRWSKEVEVEIVEKKVGWMRKHGWWKLWNLVTRGGLYYRGPERWQEAMWINRSIVEKCTPNNNVVARPRKLAAEFDLVKPSVRNFFRVPRVVTGFDFPCMALGLLKHWMGGKWTCCIWDPPVLWVRDEHPRFTKIVDWVFRFFIKRADKIILNIHPGLLEEIGVESRGRCREIVYEMNESVNLDAYKSEKKHSTFTIGVVSRAETKKGYELVREAVARLKSEGVEVELDWISGVGFEEAMRRVARCQVGLVPYLPVRSLKWNYVLKLAEYYALGLEVVSCDNPGCAEMVKRAGKGRLFKSGDVEDLVRVLREVVCS